MSQLKRTIKKQSRKILKRTKESLIRGACHCRDYYVEKQVKKVQFPYFEESPQIRMGYCFSGRVQNVGFRLEVKLLADRLGLTGFAYNKKNGDVVIELQGEENKIKFLISYMRNLRRIGIRKMKKERLEYNYVDTIFEIIK